jgi:hypothetical protein
MRRHPGVELEKFGLRWVDWSSMNCDLFVDRTILAFEIEHRDLWLLVKSFLLGEDLSPIASGYTPWKEPTQTELLTAESSSPIAASFQAEICDTLNVNNSFVAGVQAKAVQPKPPPKTVIRETNGQRVKMPVEDPGATEKHVLGAGPRYLRGQQQW